MDYSGGDATTEPSSDPPEHPQRKSATYLFHGQTTSLCETCLEPVPAKIIIEDEDVFYLKRCRAHGVQKTLISDDLDYWRQQKLWIKPGDRPLKTQTRTEAGCPFDCGLCPDHEQHSCLAIIEINEACNLACPVCFANRDGHPRQPSSAGPDRADARCAWSRARASRTWSSCPAASRPSIRTSSPSSTQ